MPFSNERVAHVTYAVPPVATAVAAAVTTADGARATAGQDATGTGPAAVVVTAVLVGSTGGAMSAGGRGHPVGLAGVWHAGCFITRGHLYVRYSFVAADRRLLLSFRDVVFCVRWVRMADFG